MSSDVQNIITIHPETMKNRCPKTLCKNHVKIIKNDVKKGPKIIPKSTKFHPKSVPNPSQIGQSGVPGRVPGGGPPTVCPLIMIFPPFWRRRAAFGRPLGPRWARRGSPKRHFSGPISEKTGKNGVREPFREGHAILLKKRCETGPAGWLKTRIPVDTSLKI